MFKHLLITLLVSLIINIAMFLVAFKYKTDKLTDISYSASFIALVLYSLLAGTTNSFKLALGAMVGIWAVRLGGFLLIRIWDKGKDKRFDGMRENFKAFGQFWVLQAVTVWVVLLPVMLVMFKDNEVAVFGKLAAIGVLLWALGLSIETMADLQKYEFSSEEKNKGKWIETGLWSLSRHPNYFGEIVLWVGVYIFTLSALSGGQALLGLVGPLFITLLLLRVSGIPILEKSADKRWGDNQDYRIYKKRTKLLVPLPKKRHVHKRPI